MRDITRTPGPARRPTGQALIPAALLLLLSLVAALTISARAAERSHRATAESALRDYAAFAAWEFTRQTQDALASRVHGSLVKAHRLRLGPTDPLPPAALLSPDGAECGCGFATDTRFAFRIDLRDGAVTTAGRADAATHVSLARRHHEFLAAARDGLGRRDVERADELSKWARVVVDTLGAGMRVLAYTVVRDRAETPRAIYGIAADPSGVTKLFDCRMTHNALLPPSLVGEAPNDSVLHLAVATPAALPVYARGASASATLAASDTMPAWLGGLVTTVQLRPSVAESLLIGGIPTSRLPMYLMVLGAAVLLAVIALVQLRRGRELARLRSQFVANVSHELRTPLAQISMFSETLMLDRERSSEERRHFLSVIFREARRLTNLVDGVLRFSGGEAGMSRVRPERRDVVADARETLEAFRPLAASADVTIRLVAPERVHAWADHAAVRQILLNLLDNAVKYGPHGQTVAVRIERDGDAVIVAVEDDGVGIPEADRQRVFEPFARLDRPGVPRVSGSGIGLSVVRDLVAAHHGRVWIESRADRPGTRIAFTLPLAHVRDGLTRSEGLARAADVAGVREPEIPAGVTGSVEPARSAALERDHDDARASARRSEATLEGAAR